ncbi:hypothetical protein HU200_010962 [Digitaria exilis]|uniref:Uncharacterized protein n=1 Tax=Digitaria exilis TaxID=1010633 RepID=A0A835FH72_9POAL|nr:hypothetical protein HU200_010962 [Digitaria exilis]
MNSRPIVLIFLLLVLIITSQFEWKQQVGEAETSPTTTRRRQHALEREDAVKEKVSILVELVTSSAFIWLQNILAYKIMSNLQIILAQEKNIQQLNELIQSLQLQLLHCRGSNSTAHTTSTQSTGDNEVEGKEMIGD